MRLDLDGFTVTGEWPSLVESEALPLFLDGLSPPEPSEQDFERERRQLVTESRHLDEGLRPSLRLLKRQLFRSHPYQLEPTLLSLSGLSRKRLSELSRRAYLPSQMTLVVIGDVDPSAVRSLVESRLQSGARPPAAQPPSPPAIETPRQFLSYHGRDQALLALGFRVAGLTSTDRAALGLLYEVLLGPSGRLHRELVERRGLLLSLEGHLERGLLGGALLVGAVTTPASLDSAEASLRDELRRVIDHPLSDEEFAAAQQRLIGREATQGQRRGDLAQALARRTALGLPSSDEDEKLLLALTPTQVQDVARRYLDERQALLQAVLPQALLAVRRGDAPEAKPKLLAKLTPSGKGSATHQATTKPKTVKKTGSAKAVRKQGSRR
jgi:zinc protease